MHSVEGIAFSLQTAVIMAGNFVTEEEVEAEKVNSWGFWFKSWFYFSYAVSRKLPYIV